MRHCECLLLLAAPLTIVAACTRKSDNASARPDSAANATVGPAARDSTGAMARTDSGRSAMAGVATLTGNPDRDFLRAMSDHHKGLIRMAHETIEGQKGSAAVKAEASTLDKKQDAELDRMVTMLERQFKDPYAPTIRPDNKAMDDTLQRQTGTAYDSTFRAMVVKHHQQGIRMIDAFLPKLTRADFKQMAQQSKADQQREIQELEQQMTARRP